MQQMDTSPLGGAVDPEVFRRVWNRVMAGGADSPIAVEQGKTAAGAAPEEPGERGAPPRGESASSQSAQQPPKGERAAPGDGVLLAAVLEELGRGLALVRRTAPAGRRGPALSALGADYRRAARQLGAAYFLTTGERWRFGDGGPRAALEPARGLRELFWWERGWSRQCLEAARQAEDDYVQQLFQRLSQTGEIHLGIIRGALEQLQPAALDGGLGRGVN